MNVDIAETSDLPPSLIGAPMRTDTSMRTHDSSHVFVSVTVALVVAILLTLVAW